MGIESTNNISQAGVSLDPSKRTDGERAQIKRLAEEFEAMLMTQMLREMRKSMLDDDDKEEQEQGFGAGPLTDTGDVELGNALSKGGGIGLTDALLKAFERQISGKASEAAGAAGGVEAAGKTGGALERAAGAIDAGRAAGAASAAGGARGAAPAAVETGKSAAAEVSQPFATLPSDGTVAAPISSRYGWRQDPFTGAAQFHHGIDIAVAYGRDVKSAADGTVSFAGVQGGYGNTVVVDHSGGRQTRYAHLSEQLVHAGDVVTEGQVLGKSGSSGRSTGPHLHFEMLVDGRPVNPTTLSE